MYTILNRGQLTHFVLLDLIAPIAMGEKKTEAIIRSAVPNLIDR